MLSYWMLSNWPNKDEENCSGECPPPLQRKGAGAVSPTEYGGGSGGGSGGPTQCGCRRMGVNTV